MSKCSLVLGGKRAITNIERVLKKHTKELAAIPNVAGLGIGEKDGKQIILIFVKKGKSAPVDKIPKKIEGYAILIKEEIEVG